MMGRLEAPLSLIDTFVAEHSELAQVLLVLLFWPVAWLIAAVLHKQLNKLGIRSAFIAWFIDQVRRRSFVLVCWFIILVFLIPALSKYGYPSNIVSLMQSLIAATFVVQYILTTFKAQAYAKFLVYTVVPLILLNSFGVLTPAIDALEVYFIAVGNIHISLYDVVRVIYFGALLPWIGKESHRLGKKTIRNQSRLDSSTKEVISKLFEVFLYLIAFLVLLNLLGISWTTITVLGGALGVGIGFGLQSIASNFVSGLIIIIDRSLSVGDYIELEDGRSGSIRELNLRSITLETFDGKDIVVPNDIFFSQTFINWTHKNLQQRYGIEFAVAYSTDLDRLFPLVKEMLAQHPQVISGTEFSFELQPDIEISNFGDNGIDLLIEFWMDAIDDGVNRVGADIKYELWKLIKEQGFEFPFPQREVRLLNSVSIEK